MTDTDYRKEIAVLVKSPGSPLQKPSSGIVRRAIQDIDLLINLDTIPIPLGIEGQDGSMILAFKKGEQFPCETVLALTLDHGTDGNFHLNVFQGFSPHVRDNVPFCKMYVQNDLAPTDQWMVRVKFVVDGNGILIVEVTDTRSQELCKLRTYYSGGLSKNQITDLESKWKE